MSPLDRALQSALGVATVRSTLSCCASFLSGCMVLSTHVSTIGLHEQTSAAFLPEEPPSAVEFFESRMEPALSNHGSIGIPYHSVMSANDGVSIGVGTLDASHIHDLALESDVPVTLGHETRTFHVQYYDGQRVTLQRRYRTPGGYAAQCFQALAVPADAVLTAGMIVVGAVGLAVSPIFIIREALRDDDEDEKEVTDPDTK